METRDFLQKQIDQLGQALAALFNKLSKKADQSIPVKDDETIQTLQDDLFIDLERLSGLSQDELMEFLINERGYSFENLENLTKVIFLISSKADEHSIIDKNLKSLEHSILTYLTANDKNFSLERKMRIEHLKSIQVK